MAFEGNTGALTIAELLHMATADSKPRHLIIQAHKTTYQISGQAGMLTAINSTPQVSSIFNIFIQRKLAPAAKLKELSATAKTLKDVEDSLLSLEIINAEQLEQARFHQAETIFFNLLSEEEGSFELQEKPPANLLTLDDYFSKAVRELISDVKFLKEFRAIYPDFDLRIYWIGPVEMLEETMKKLDLWDIKALSLYAPQTTVRKFWQHWDDSPTPLMRSLLNLGRLEIFSIIQPQTQTLFNTRPFLRLIVSELVDKIFTIQKLIGKDGDLLTILQNFKQTLDQMPMQPVMSKSSSSDLSEGMDDLSTITSTIESFLELGDLKELGIQDDHEMDLSDQKLMEQPLRSLRESSIESPLPKDVRPSLDQSPKPKSIPTPTHKIPPKPAPPKKEEEDIEDERLETLEEKVEAKVRYRKFVSNVTMAHNRMNLKSLNYFDILEVSANADRKAIHKAFVKAIHKINPKGIHIEDYDKGILDKAVQVRETLKKAYTTLMDPKLRRQYLGSLRETREDIDRKKSLAMGLFNKGMAEMKAGNYDNARKIFRQAIEYDPNSPVYYSILEDISKEERLNNATKFFQSGLIAFKQKNDAGRAIQLIKKAISLSPGQAAFHIKLAEIQASQAETRLDAIKNYEMAIDIDPGNNELKMTLANYLKSVGMKQEAANRYQEILKWNPDHARVKTELLALAKEGIKPQKAEEKDAEGKNEE